MVNLTKIYTRTGDAGNTRLSNNEVASKTDSRVEAYGCVDEANCAIGIALSLPEQLAPGITEEIREALGIVQNELFDVGADLSNPVTPNPKWEPLRVIQSSIARLEKYCDEFNEGIENLRSFILPGGGLAAAQMHVCRTAVRKAERAAWRAAEDYGLEEEGTEPSGGINPLAIKYLNRLSDLFFILARKVCANEHKEEVLWLPGGERNPNA